MRQRAADKLTRPDIIIAPCKECGKDRICDRESRLCLDRFKPRRRGGFIMTTIIGCFTKSSESNDYEQDRV